jgi:flagellar motility protein MotE (MotC chaperone)
MTSIQDPEDSEAYAKLLTERDKLKAELERQIRFVREATDERDDALEKLEAHKHLRQIDRRCSDLKDGTIRSLGAERDRLREQLKAAEAGMEAFKQAYDRTAENEVLCGKNNALIGKLFQSIGAFGVDEKDPVGTLIAFAAEWHRKWQVDSTSLRKAVKLLRNWAAIAEEHGLGIRSTDEFLEEFAAARKEEQ